MNKIHMYTNYIVTQKDYIKAARNIHAITIVPNY